MAHLRLGAGASGIKIGVRPHVCLGPPRYHFSDQVKRQSPTHSSPVWACSTLALGVKVGTSKQERVPAYSALKIDCTYCVQVPQASHVYFVPSTQLEISRDLFEKGIQLSSLGGKTWRQESEDFHIGIAGAANQREGGRSGHCLLSLPCKCAVLGRLLACVG